MLLCLNGRANLRAFKRANLCAFKRANFRAFKRANFSRSQASCVRGGLGVGGDERDRTVDLRLAKPALSQLSYIPLGAATRAHPMFGKLLMVGPSRIELPTSRLSGVRSNQLSYGPTPCGLVDQTPFER